MPGLHSMPHRHLRQAKAKGDDTHLHGSPLPVKLVHCALRWVRNIPRWRVYAVGGVGGFLAIGTLAYSHLEPEWTVLDAFYFSLVMVTTVGFGCLAPTSEGSRLFTLVYIAASYACCLPIAIGLFFTWPIESSFVLSKRLLKCLLPAWTLEARDDPRTPPGPYVFYARGYVLPYLFAWVCLLLTAIVVLLVPAGHFSNSLADGERQLTYLESIYFAAVSSSTIGFGDICPVRQDSRAYMCLLLPVSAGFITWLVTVVGDLLHTRMTQLRLASLLSKPLDQLLAAELPEGSIDRGIDKADFLVAMLLASQLVPKEDLTSFVEQFNRLDEDGSGVLDRADLVHFSWENHPTMKGAAVKPVSLEQQSTAADEYATGESSRTEQGAMEVHRI